MDHSVSALLEADIQVHIQIALKHISNSQTSCIPCLDWVIFPVLISSFVLCWMPEAFMNSRSHWQCAWSILELSFCGMLLSGISRLHQVVSPVRRSSVAATSPISVLGLPSPIIPCQNELLSRGLPPLHRHWVTSASHATLSLTPDTAQLVTAVTQVPMEQHVLILTASYLCQSHHVLMCLLGFFTYTTLRP